MKAIYKQDKIDSTDIVVELTPHNLKRDMEKTRMALDAAYAGFNDATDFDMIDSYIFEMNALQRRYKHLTDLAQKEGLLTDIPLRKHSPIRAWVARIFG